MIDNGIAGLILIAINVLGSYKGFKDGTFFDTYKFQVDKILIGKEYKRLLSSGFLHVDWTHLLFNMVSLYAFTGLIELQFGWSSLLIIYFGSLIGGGLLALYIHRHHGDYSAVGASGAVCGVIFTSIALFPGMVIGFFGLPIYIPSWLYGIFFVLFSIYGIKSKRDNIGHEAHLGGALIGMLIGIALQPSSLNVNYLPILLVLIPALIFIYLIITKPHVLLLGVRSFAQEKRYHSIDDKYNDQRVSKQKEVDLLLEKISKQGVKSLNAREKKILEEYSRSGGSPGTNS